MSIVKQSFLSNLIGRNTYEAGKEYAKPVVLIGSCILLVLYVLSHFFHLGIICYLVGLTNGMSLLFIGFIAELILLLDMRVEVEEPERNAWDKPEKKPRPVAYKLTIVWAIVLVLLGILAIYYSNKYRNQYSFECDTFLVDTEAGIYHFDWNDDCEKAEEAGSLEEMKGYQIDESYTLCEWCKETQEDMESEY